MPKLEHANIVVAAIDPTMNFLTTAFPGWRLRGEGRDDWRGKPRRWAHIGDDDTYLTLNEFTPRPENQAPPRDLDGADLGLAHIGFEVNNVDAIVGRLKEAGHEPRVWGPDHPHRRNVYFIAEEGLEIEFVEYLSDAPAERNLYV